MSANILDDWNLFCQGKMDFDKSHFYTLFMEQKDPEYFKKALQYFPNSDGLLERMGRVVGFGNPQELEAKVKSPEDALKYASMDLQERIRIAEEYGEAELVAELSKLRPKYSEDFEDVEKFRHEDLHGWMLEVVGDYFRDQLYENTEKLYGLLDAFYGLTTRFEIKWFLGTPLTNGGFNLDNYFELWRVGADYAVKDGQLLVGSRKLLK